MSEEKTGTEVVPSNKKLAEIFAKVEPHLKKIMHFLEKAIPILIEISQKGYAFYCKLSTDVLNLIIGFIYCFFGGVYPTLFASMEAAKHGGLTTLREAISDLAEEAVIIIEASKKDDDEHQDDSKEEDKKEYLVRKTKLVLVKMNPQKVDTALANMYSVWISVLATLSVQFARTIVLSLTIAEYVRKVLDRFVIPNIIEFVPPEYHKWIPIVAGWVGKSIGMSIAWTAQTIISALTSAMLGGLIISRTFLKFCRAKDIDFGGIIPKTDEETNIDEYAAYAIAVIGFYTQLRSGFSMPFPLNLFLFPLDVAEYYIRWSITN